MNKIIISLYWIAVNKGTVNKDMIKEGFVTFTLYVLYLKLIDKL